METIPFLEGAFEIDATLLGRALELPPASIPELLRNGAITSRCERGVGDDEGRYRLTFFHGGRRLRIVVDESGRVLRLSNIDFGNRPLPPSLRRAGAGAG